MPRQVSKVNLAYQNAQNQEKSHQYKTKPNMIHPLTEFAFLT